MRIKDEIAYSKIHGQYFYIIGAIKDMLNANAVQSNDEYVQELIAKGKSYIKALVTRIDNNKIITK